MSESTPSMVQRVAEKTDTAPEFVQEVFEYISRESHQGPLPSPQTFAQYEDVCPGAAREILNMAIREQQHGHDQDKLALTSEVSYRILAIVLAASLVALFVIGAVVCAVSGHDGPAIALGSAATIMTGAGVFIRGRNLFGSKETKEELEQAAPADSSATETQEPTGATSPKR